MGNASLTHPASADDLGPRWRALEAASNPGPFRTWTFVNRVAARFTAPQLLAVRENGQDLALAMLNRAGNRLHLHETGDRTLDAVFIEHNGLLFRPGAEHLLPDLLRQLAPVVLSGVDDLHLDAARQAGPITGHLQRFAPAADLSFAGAYLDTLSANARAQIRRAMRLCGPDLAIRRAPDLRTAHAWFDEMVALHQAAWQARGKPGAFASEATRGFHKTLIGTAHPRNEADLLRVTAGSHVVGVLYLLRQAGHVCVYQSGFAAAADPREKPGLVCHAMAIEFYRSEGATMYDLLAGADRYKTSLARTGGRMLHWFTLHPFRSLRARGQVLAERMLRR